MWLLIIKFASLIVLTRTGLSYELVSTGNIFLNGTCPPHRFDCGNGKCVDEMFHCDGDNDCGNLRDEHDCENHKVETKCFSSQFKCETVDHCIPEKWHCDGDKDCDDGSDEKKCECSGFTCRDHRCIPLKWRCDGNKDCDDGSDEELCSGKLCSDSEFLCSSGSCVKQNLVCDGNKDCADGSDEGSNCTNHCENATCSQNCTSTPFGPRCYCNDGYVLDPKDSKACLDVDECLEEGFCSHHCTNSPGGYACTCQIGYDLVGRTCRARGGDPLLVFSSTSEIRAIRLRSQEYFLVRRSTSKAVSLDVDPKTQQVYWCELSEKSAIFSAKIDGSATRMLFSHGLQVPEGIAVDYVANNLYLTDSGLQQVMVCKMDGTICHVLHKTNVEKPRSIVLDLSEGLLYWSDWGNHAAGIYRSGMDGSRRINFVSTRIAWPNSIALDHTTNRLYWADAKLNTIEYMTLEGTSRKVIMNTTAFHPFSLTVFEDNIYWSDWSTFSLESCNKFTGHKVRVLAKENGRHIMGVHVYHPVLIARVSNPCWSNDCSHMCLISPVSGFRCACPHGFELGKDGKTCTMSEISEAIFVSEGSSVFYIRPGAVGSETIDDISLPFRTVMISKVAFNKNLRYLFVADVSTPAIHAVNMTSLHMRLLVKSDIDSPEDLSFDWRSNNLYWIDSVKGTIEVISVDSLQRSVIVENLSRPIALAISPNAGLMFVATMSSIPSVTMYDMDGRNIKRLNSVQGVPLSIALHPTKSILYWADPNAGTISYVNYTASRSSRILISRIDGVVSVAASENSVYWTTRKRELNLLKKNITHILQLPGEERGVVTRKVTYSSGILSLARSECMIGNGGCSHLCLTSSRGRTCVCPPELVLANDSVTCEARRCEASDFKCVDGQCLPSELRCDGYSNCLDGSDETGCNRCPGDDFQCRNGRCILKSWQCDGRNDCADNSDEENCASTTCIGDHIACSNGQCVSVLWRCDGERDCEDGTDEINCNGTSCDSVSHFRCENGQCIPLSWVCDKTEDCKDNSDERNCSFKTCTVHEFKCESDGTCVDELLKCDGRPNCKDGSDERNCPNSRRDCKIGMHRCKDGACIYEHELCDGHNDCSNNEDELNCTQTLCQPEEHLCPSSKKCIIRRWICDGDADCPDKSDEDNCVEQKAQPKPSPAPIDSECKEFYCYATHTCLPWSKVCDGRQDCDKLNDEGGLCAKSCSRDNGGCTHACIKTPYGAQCSCDRGYRLLEDNRTCGDVDECTVLGSCSHFCNNTKGGFKCRCAEGYILHNNHRHCKADGDPAILMYLLADQIRGINLADLTQKVFLNISVADMKGMDYDSSKGVFFWTELKDGSINSYSSETKQRKVILYSSSKPIIVRYDWIAQNLYFRDRSSRIAVCTVDGKYTRTIVPSSMTGIDSMDIAPVKGLIFWTIWANMRRDRESGLIERAEMDGSHRIAIVSHKTNAPTAITVDHVLSMIYWSDKQLNILECADFNGLKRRQVVRSNMYHPSALAVFEDDVYWADWGSDSIIRCNKFTNGANCTPIIDVRTNVLMIVQKAMQPTSENRCLSKNCTHLSLLTRSSCRCACDDVNDGTCRSEMDVVPISLASLSSTSVSSASPTSSPPPPFSSTLASSKSTVSPDKCPKNYCEGGSECQVKNGKFECLCSPPYSGPTCEVKAAATQSTYNYNWIIAFTFAIVLTVVIVLGILMCIRNREKIQRMRETVSVKFLSPKSGRDGHLVTDTDDGSCEELVIEPKKEYRQPHSNCDYTLADSEDGDLKRWPSDERDSPLLNNDVTNFFRKLKLNASAL